MQENSSGGTSIKDVRNTSQHNSKISHFAFKPTELTNSKLHECVE
jgi:hypothetical protein